MRPDEAYKLIQDLKKDVTSTGISTTSGLNFYFLEEQAKTIYPVYYPLLASVPRKPPMYGGQRVGGPAVNWKAIVGINNGGYPAISEGNRNAAMKFIERDYSANHKYLGQDDFVTFQAEFTGLGFDDNLSLSMAATLNQSLNDEERMILFGNEGTANGGNGFQLGTCGTVTIAGPTTGAGVPNADQIYVACIALTGWGVTLGQSVATAGVQTGVQLPFVRQTMNGAQDQINGGTSAYSAIAGPSSAASTASGIFTATVAAISGAMGYAWYVGTSNAYSALYFYSMTSAPTVTINALASSSNQAANASSSAGSFATDNSANALDFCGETTYSFAKGGYWKDLGGANLTSNGDSTIAEFDAFQDYMWTNYKIWLQKIWLGGTLINAVTKKIQGAGTTSPVTRFVATMDKDGNIQGGSRASSYLCKYGPKAGLPVPIETHPWLPQGVVFFELLENPYPAAANAIPTVRRIITLEERFGILWPYTTLQHQYGVYVFETLQVYIPFGMGLLTGVGAS